MWRGRCVPRGTDVTISQDYQFEITNSAGDSLLLGPTTNFRVLSVDGLGGPPLRTSDSARPRDHGQWIGADYMDARMVVLELAVTGASADATITNLDRLKGMWIPDTDPNLRAELAFRLPGAGNRKVRGRVRRIDVDLSQVQFLHVPVTAEFFANDPHLLSESSNWANVPISSSVGANGVAYPKAYPIDYGGYVSSDAQVTNDGNMPARPIITFFGPLTDPTVTNETTGETFALDITLSAGQVLVCDFDARTVLLGGNTSRYYAVANDAVWWSLLPGLNTIRLTDAATGTGRASISWYDTWI